MGKANGTAISRMNNFNLVKDRMVLASDLAVNVFQNC